MEKEIKPIETVYKGFKFRSRLEARWAVFFEEGKIRYEYEPEGFTLSDGTRYLPDFYLPDFDAYVEVKGEREGAWDELMKAYDAVKWGSPVKRIIVLGNIPPADTGGGLYNFPIIYSLDAYPWVGWWKFFTGDYVDGLIIGSILMSNPMFYPWIKNYSEGKPQIYKCRPLSFQAVSDIKLHKEFFGEDISDSCYEDDFISEATVFLAYDKARKARFEHGETPT